MRNYETVFIIDPKVDDAGVKALIEKFSNLINNDGKVEKVEEKGMQKLAYEINKNAEGNYVVIDFQANPSLIDELQRVLRITDGILKFIVIKDVQPKNNN